MKSESCSLNTTIHRPGRQAFNTIPTHTIVACSSGKAHISRNPPTLTARPHTPPGLFFPCMPPLSSAVLMTSRKLPHIHPLGAKIITLELRTRTVTKLELGARTQTWICINPSSTVGLLRCAAPLFPPRSEKIHQAVKCGIWIAGDSMQGENFSVYSRHTEQAPFPVTLLV